MTEMLNQMLASIIEEQSQIIGPMLSRARAEDTGLIKFQSDNMQDLEVSGESKEVMEKLIMSYGEIFGNASIDVCLDALSTYPKEEVSQVLPNNLLTKLAK